MYRADMVAIKDIVTTDFRSILVEKVEAYVQMFKVFPSQISASPSQNILCGNYIILAT